MGASARGPWTYPGGDARLRSDVAPCLRWRGIGTAALAPVNLPAALAVNGLCAAADVCVLRPLGLAIGSDFINN